MAQQFILNQISVYGCKIRHNKIHLKTTWTSQYGFDLQNVFVVTVDIMTERNHTCSSCPERFAQMLHYRYVPLYKYRLIWYYDCMMIRAYQNEISMIQACAFHLSVITLTISWPHIQWYDCHMCSDVLQSSGHWHLIVVHACYRDSIYTKLSQSDIDKWRRKVILWSRWLHLKPELLYVHIWPLHIGVLQQPQQLPISIYIEDFWPPSRHECIYENLLHHKK